MGARSAGNPHAACDVEGTGNVARSSGLPARQSSTLPVGTGGGQPPPVTRWMWKRSHGYTAKAPPDERGGNRYVQPKATAPHLDLYECAAVKGVFSVMLSDLDSLLVTDLGARSSPAAAKRCAKGAGLEGAPKSVTSSKRSQIFSAFVWSFFRYPRRALCVRAALAAPTYIRPGTTRSKVPHARCEGSGSKGDGTILYRGVFQPCRNPVTHPPWIS